VLQLSTVIGVAIPEERAERKWIEGIAIWAAILLVTLVSECHATPQTQRYVSNAVTLPICMQLATHLRQLAVGCRIARRH
jgi:hypothetical protein